MKPIDLSRPGSTIDNGNSQKVVTSFDSISSESRVLNQILQELTWARQEIAELQVERLQLLEQIKMLGNNEHQETGDTHNKSSMDQDLSTENIAFTNEGSPPVDQE